VPRPWVRSMSSTANHCGPPLAEVVSDWRQRRPRTSQTSISNHYRRLQPPWNDWQHVVARGRHWAQVVAAWRSRVIMKTDRSRPLVRSGIDPGSIPIATRCSPNSSTAARWPRGVSCIAGADRIARLRTPQSAYCPDCPAAPAPLSGWAALCSLGESVDFAAAVPDTSSNRYLNAAARHNL